MSGRDSGHGRRSHDDGFEELLRGALRDEAGRQEPAGDGLVRIRERVARRRRPSWLRPTLALAGAAALVAAVVVLPQVLSRSRPDQGAPAGSPVASSLPASPLTTAGTTGTPTAGSLATQRTVWPYPNRAVAATQGDVDVRTGRYPDLTDPKGTAIDFVQAFVGPNVQLTVEGMERGSTGVTVRLGTSRADGSTLPLTTVRLARTRAGTDAPYVVIDAAAAALITLDSLPPVRGTSAYTVSGALDPAATPGLLLKVELREPGSTDRLGVQSVPVAGTAGRQPWSATLAPFQALTSTGVLAAWTVDDAGTVHGFVAAPTGAP